MGNYVFSLAQSRGVQPVAILQELVDNLMAAHNRILDVLKVHQKAYEMYKDFNVNYIGFHLTAKRYKIAEIPVITSYLKEHGATHLSDR